MKQHTGPHGTATQVLAEPRTKDQTATLATWFLRMPAAHPIWPHYVLSVIHLRDIPGVKPAKKKYPEAEYELIVIALNPEANPVADNIDTWRYLTPVNVSIQFHGCTDERAAEIGELAARACIEGILWPETQDIHGMREKWSVMIPNHIGEGE